MDDNETNLLIAMELLQQIAVLDPITSSEEQAVRMAGEEIINDSCYAKFIN